jgi:outer membrane protein assembly factor BamB
MKKHLMILAAVALLSGCSSMNPLEWFARGEDVVPPAALKPLTGGVVPRTLWSASVGHGSDKERLRLAPFVLRGKVYAADADGLLQARDALTGKMVWEANKDLAFSGGPGGGEDLVLIGTRGGQVLAFDADNGTERWTGQVASEVLSAPKTAAGIAVVHSADGTLTGLDARTGERIWSMREEPPKLTLRASASPVISGGAVICGFADGKLVSVDLPTGRVRWEANAGIPKGRSELERLIDVAADPVVLDGVVYVVSFQGDAVAVAEDTGIALWRRPLSSYAGLTADWRQLYVTDTSDTVWAVQQSNGAALWRQRDFFNRRLTAPAVLGDYVIVGDFEGYVHLLSRSDGSEVGRTRVGGGPITAQPVVVGDVAYVYGDDGSLAALSVSAAGH